MLSFIMRILKANRTSGTLNTRSNSRSSAVYPAEDCRGPVPSDLPPFVPQFSTCSHISCPRSSIRPSVFLLSSHRSMEERLLHSEFEILRQRHPKKFNMMECISENKEGDGNGSEKSLPLQSRLSSTLFATALTSAVSGVSGCQFDLDRVRTLAIICGPANYVSVAEDLCTEAGFKSQKIRNSKGDEEDGSAKPEAGRDQERQIREYIVL
jgi:hypothetical protein